MTTPEQLKALLAPLRSALYDWTADGVQSALQSVFAPTAQIRLGFPFEDLDGPHGFYHEALAPLALSWPDIERREMMVVAGTTGEGLDWVGCGGYYTGTFTEPWLDIPPTGRQSTMRFHEFFQLVDGRVVQMQALWDIPEVMLQAYAWPMAPSLGREWSVPSPATQDGLGKDRDPTRSVESYNIVRSMLDDMTKHPTEPVEAMNLERYWHPKCSWYGPAGIGTGRGISGFRTVHQIPFLNAMPDRGGGPDSHFFAEGDFVAVTGWPNMSMTVSGDGWLGIVPPDTAITMRSLDFWRVEGDLIRENWVLVDLLSMWHQLGVDVFTRMRELPPRGR